jgi:hypothetical protein
VGGEKKGQSEIEIEIEEKKRKITDYCYRVVSYKASDAASTIF